MKKRAAERSPGTATPMPTSARTHAGATASLQTGVVEGAADEYVSVRFGDGRTALARRATSCLVEPLVGDRVLVAEEGDLAFLLAILEREAGAATSLSTAGDLEIAPRGKFVVTAPAGVHLATAHDMTLSATKLEAVADEASLMWKVVRVASRAAIAEIAKIDLVAEQSTSVIGRVFQKAKRVFRSVEETETLRTGQRSRASGMLRSILST